MTHKPAVAIFSGLALLGVGLLLSRPTSDSLRRRIISIAVAEQASPRASTYLTAELGSPLKVDWCGIFILWALHQARVALDVHWVLGKGFLQYTTLTTMPKVADIAYFAKNQHQALVKSVDGSMVTLINGNDVGGAIGTSTINRSNVTAFYSIEPLIQKVLS